MSTQEAWRNRVHRKARAARIIQHLERVDDATLEHIDALIQKAITGDAPPPPPRATRRDFLRAAAAGGMLVATTGGLAVWQLGFGRLDAAEDEAAALHGLVDLHESMAATDLDGAVARTIPPLDEQIDALHAAAASLHDGIEQERAALTGFQSDLPSLHAAMQWLQQASATLAQRMLALENSVDALLGVSGPLTETMGGLMGWVLGQLPPQEAAAAHEALERTGEVVSALPELMEGLYTRVLEPLQDTFSQHAAGGLNQRLIVPTLTDVIEPAAALTAQVTLLSAVWEETLLPLQRALSERETIRTHIRQYEADHNV
ncbi:MAG: twin-arginine translocation signal domain-containing protein [Anaerolineae bacterium]|nr:twin-arginine translocation signal domain-containing protein [Anaerolineae bacterium]